MKIEEKRFFIVGAGKVGGALGLLLKRSGLRITGVVDKDKERGLKLGKKLGADDFSGRWNDIGESSDVIIISVPDDVVSDVVEKMVNGKVIQPGTFVCHTSGVHTSRVLEPARERGGILFSIHPLVSITDSEGLLEVIEETFFVLEGDPEGIEMGAQIVERLGANYFTVLPDKKPLYHAAASILSNYMTTLFGISSEILSDIGIDPDDIHEGLCTLLGSTFLNLAKSDPVDALTGPVARGDLETIKLHMEALENYDIELKKLYAEIGKFTLRIAEAKGCDSKKLELIRREFDVRDH
jgi:predicted short-subunit dehydrogenase-like oxidoreductase (DUF2520 family)